MKTYRVLAADTGEDLEGTPSEELIEASEDAGPLGAVPAYQDADDVWQYVHPDEVAYHTGVLCETVLAVYVEEA